MKTVLSRLLVVVAIVSFLSCNKNDSATKTLSTSPEALIANDAKSGGVYKGVVIGSTGVVKIILQNGQLVAEVTIDGITKQLVSADLAGWTSGEPIEGAVFKKDDWKVTFSVNADGSGAELMAEIPGHTAIAVVMVKEFSHKQVTAFEGTYSIDGVQLKGTWNFLTYGNHLVGIYRLNENDDVLAFYGELSGNAVSAVSGEVQITGAVTGTTAAGTWTSTQASGKWSGKRTL